MALCSSSWSLGGTKLFQGGTVLLDFLEVFSSAISRNLAYKVPQGQLAP